MKQDIEECLKKHDEEVYVESTYIFTELVKSFLLLTSPV